MLEKYCLNKGLLGLLFSEILKQDSDYEEYSEDKYKNKNLLKREIISIFKNVTYLEIDCRRYPLSLESLLELIHGTQIKEVMIEGDGWLYKAKEMPSFDNISSKYKESNFNLEFKKEYGQEKLFITYNK